MLSHPVASRAATIMLRTRHLSQQVVVVVVVVFVVVDGVVVDVVVFVVVVVVFSVVDVLVVVVVVVVATIDVAVSVLPGVLLFSRKHVISFFTLVACPSVVTSTIHGSSEQGCPCSVFPSLLV